MRVRGLAGAAAGVLLLLGFTGSAQAAETTFQYTGSAQAWTVPAGVTQASFALLGAQGHTGQFGGQGRGGSATATIPVTPGETLQVTVGGMGRVGGFNGGGQAGCGAESKPGGGATDVRRDADADGSYALTERLLVAGGGGADAAGSGGAGGGTSGATGQPGSPAGGGGATQSAGGAGGDTGVGILGQAGRLGLGGAPGDCQSGGGGGGLYGGGGGTIPATGGGGGSGFTPDGTGLASGVRSGNGEVTVTYVPDLTPPTITIRRPTATPGYSLGQSVAADYACADESGGSGLATCTGTVADGQPINTSSLGPKSFTVTATDHAGNPSTQTVTYRVALLCLPILGCLL